MVAAMIADSGKAIVKIAAVPKAQYHFLDVWPKKSVSPLIRIAADKNHPRPVPGKRHTLRISAGRISILG